jgi:hypothetical protein
MDYLQETKEGVVLKVKIQPRASRNEVAGPLGDALKIRLQAPPVDGKANKALLRFLAKTLGLSTRQIRLVHGETHREKRLLIIGSSAKDIRSHLQG